jgi:unsaturated chondroitin disaccharide hydrolase
MASLPSIPRRSLQEVLDEALARVTEQAGSFGHRFPTVGEGTRYRLAANDSWLAAFWPGMLWLAYAATGDARTRGHAAALLPSFASRLDGAVHINHDLGFLYSLSARAQWQLVGDTLARELALRAAAALLQRYREPGRYLQAWGPIGDPEEGGRIIVDTMMNLPLLFWASEQTGDIRFRQAASAHALTSRQYLIRPDGGSYHTFFFDQESGAPQGPRTHQGYADDSLWARGQGWAIYGFAVAAEWCQESRFLDTARQAARRFVAELPPGLPPWDLRLPAGPPRYPDSSAAAIAAGGMLRLARLGGWGPGNEFYEAASLLLQRLVEDCLETHPDGQGLLRHGTYNAPKAWGVDAYFIPGDYFFLEALLAHADRAPDFWGPGPQPALQRSEPVGAAAHS